MSCPDWRSLVAARDARREDPPGWQVGLEHLEGCPDCRRRALAADPTLVFRRLPGMATSRSEIESMRGAVAALRRAGRLVADDDAGAPAAGYRRWGLSAAAAVLAGVALMIAPGSGHPTPGTLVAAEPEPATAYVEELDLPQARIYQLAEEEISVVWIVDESLDL